MVTYKAADVMDELYEWTAKNQPQIRLTVFMAILTYVWRVTNNFFGAPEEPGYTASCTCLEQDQRALAPRYNPPPHSAAGPSGNQNVHHDHRLQRTRWQERTRLPLPLL